MKWLLFKPTKLNTWSLTFLLSSDKHKFEPNPPFPKVLGKNKVRSCLARRDSQDMEEFDGSTISDLAKKSLYKVHLAGVELFGNSH